MKKTVHLFFVLLLAVTLSAVLAACGGTAEPTQPPAAPADTPVPPADTPVPPPPAEPVTLIVGFDIQASSSMDPHQMFELAGAMADYAAYEPLVKITAQDFSTPVPWLAESWDISADGLTYTFHLRPGVTFSSGNPLTAEDVRFSWMRLKNKQGPPSWFMGWVADVQVMDDLTVNVILHDPSPGFIMVATAPYLGIMDSKVVQEHGGSADEDSATTDTATPWLDQNSAGSGPFILTSFTPKSEVVLEANPTYWGEKAKADRIILKHVEDPTTALQMLQRGDLDLLPRLDPDLVEEAKADPNLQVDVLETLDITYMNMTCDPTLSVPLSDVRVRQAILLALDRDGLIQSGLRGYALKPPSILPLGLAGVEESMIQPRDVERAKALLKEAGYENGFTEKFYYPARPLFDLVGAKIKNDLAEVGINVELQPTDYSVLVSMTWGEHTAPWVIGNWYPDYIDYTIYTDYWGYASHDWGANMRCEVPPELEAATDIISHGLDSAERLQAVKDWQAIMLDFAYGTTLYQANELIAMRKEVTGFGYIPVVYTEWGQLGR